MTTAEIQFHSQRLNVRLTPEILAKPIATVRETVEVDGGYEEFWGQPVPYPSELKTIGKSVITKGDIVARAANRREYRKNAHYCREMAPPCESWGEFLDATKYHTWPEYRMPVLPHPLDSSTFDPFQEEA